MKKPGAHGPKIAEGRTAEIFEYGAGKVLKLFRKDFSAQAANEEYRISRAVAEVYPAAPKVYEMTRVDGRIGMVLERIDGPSLVGVLKKRIWKTWSVARISAEVHCGILDCKGDGLPSQKERIRKFIGWAQDLGAGERDAILKHLDSLPDGDSLCHGDMHQDNILMSNRGPVVIDWICAVKGCKAAEIGRALLLAESPAMPPGIPALLVPIVKIMKHILAAGYLRHALRISGVRREDVEPWMLPLAAARLSEWPPRDERQFMLKMIRRRLNTLGRVREKA